jgi:hypothetical protein
MVSEFLQQIPSDYTLSAGTIPALTAGASSFFAQETPPINASFWVEMNAPPFPK